MSTVNQLATISGIDNVLTEVDLPTYNDLVAMLRRTSNAINDFQHTLSRAGCNAEGLLCGADTLLARIPD